MTEEFTPEQKQRMIGVVLAAACKQQGLDDPLEFVDLFGQGAFKVHAEAQEALEALEERGELSHLATYVFTFKKVYPDGYVE